MGFLVRTSFLMTMITGPVSPSGNGYPIRRFFTGQLPSLRSVVLCSVDLRNNLCKTNSLLSVGVR